MKLSKRKAGGNLMVEWVPVPSEEHDILLIEGWTEVKRERRGGGRLWALLAAGAEPHPSIPNAWILKED